MTTSINTQLFSSKAVTGAGEHYEELKARCEKFQRLLCKAEEELKLKDKKVNLKLVIGLLKKKQLRFMLSVSSIFI